MRRQWKRGREEITPILSRRRYLVRKESVRREDFVECFYGANTPLFGMFRQRLDWDHRHFLNFISTSMRLSANSG